MISVETDPEDHGGHHVAGEPGLRSYEEFPPSDVWERWVWSCWRFQVASEPGSIFHVIPPDGTVSLIVGRAGDGESIISIVVGPHLKPRTGDVRAGEWWLGVRFWPGAARGLFELPARSLRDTMLPLEDALPSLAVTLESGVTDPSTSSLELFQDVIWKHYDSRRADEAVVAASRTLFHAAGTCRIETLAEKTGLSARQLRRRFQNAAGISPKELARLFRARAASVELLDERQTVSGVSHQAGYADHPHMVRDFKAVVGPAPHEARDNLKGIRHGWVRRSSDCDPE